MASALLLSRQIARPEGSFLVLSYNLLCHSSKHLGYCKLTKEDLPWERRWANFVREFEQYDADLLCFQEVNKFMYLELLKYFGGQGFEGQHIAKHHPREPEDLRWNEETLGQAIFVRHNRFEVIASSSSLLQEHFTDDEKSAKDENGLLKVIDDRAEGVLCMTLREVGGGKRVLLACAHPVYYYTPPTFATKPVQIALTMRAVAKFAVANGVSSANVVVCGDWNSTPGNGGYLLATSGALEPSHAEHPAQNGWQLPALSNDLGALRSCYAAAGAENTYTTKTNTFVDALDHIFVGSALQVAAVLPLPPQESLVACPNDEWASDHLAIGAFLKL